MRTAGKRRIPFSLLINKGLAPLLFFLLTATMFTVPIPGPIAILSTASAATPCHITPGVIAHSERLRIGTLPQPDAIPFAFAAARPLFAKIGLAVELVTVHSEMELEEGFSRKELDAVICDLPLGIALAASKTTPARIVRTILRSNPYRPLFALGAAPTSQAQPMRSLTDLEGKTLAVPKGMSFGFYTDCFLGQAGKEPVKVVRREVSGMREGWELLLRGQVSGALLRTPYTDAARQKGLTFLADDRLLPRMSVLVTHRFEGKKEGMERKTSRIKSLLLGLEQAVLALNIKPARNRWALAEKGLIPADLRGSLPMPVFEGANAPTESELKPVMEWLAAKHLIEGALAGEDLVDLRFLPDPEKAGVASCCD